MMMNVHDEIFHRLSSKTRMRQLFKDLHAEEMERMISRMNDILEEKQEARMRFEEQRKQKSSNINEALQFLAERGLSVDDLGITEGETASVKRRRNLQRYTFEYQDESGQTHQWEGATTGRLPSAFQSYLQRTGKSRLDCALQQLEG